MSNIKCQQIDCQSLRMYDSKKKDVSLSLTMCTLLHNIGKRRDIFEAHSR